MSKTLLHMIIGPVEPVTVADDQDIPVPYRTAPPSSALMIGPVSGPAGDLISPTAKTPTNPIFHS